MDFSFWETAKKVLDLSHLTRNLIMIQLKDIVERHAFGVCSYLGEKMNIASSRVRLYFIYISFVTLGSPVIFYLFLAFWVNIRRYIKRHKDAFFG
jgi:phage shock protein C